MRETHIPFSKQYRFRARSQTLRRNTDTEIDANRIWFPTVQIHKDVAIECKIRTMKQESSDGITNERIRRTNVEYIRPVRSGTRVDASSAPGIRMRSVIRLGGVIEVARTNGNSARLHWLDTTKYYSKIVNSFCIQMHP